MNDTTRSAHKSEATASSQEARSAQKPSQKITGASSKETFSPHQAAIFRTATGIDDPDFWIGILCQLAGASSNKGVIDKQQYDFMMSVILERKSTPKFEIMLATQVAAVHSAMMTFGRKLANATSIEETNVIGNIFTKLARTSAIQVEVMQRLQSTGEQKITVQNVSVSEGGQAIVGNVTQNARDDNKAKAAISPALITDAHATPMPIIERSEQPVVVPAKRRTCQ
jgi:hypothetical protein